MRCQSPGGAQKASWPQRSKPRPGQGRAQMGLDSGCLKPTPCAGLDPPRGLRSGTPSNMLSSHPAPEPLENLTHSWNPAPGTFLLTSRGSPTSLTLVPFGREAGPGSRLWGWGWWGALQDSPVSVCVGQCRGPQGQGGSAPSGVPPELGGTAGACAGRGGQGGVQAGSRGIVCGRAQPRPSPVPTPNPPNGIKLAPQPSRPAEGGGGGRRVGGGASPGSGSWHSPSLHLAGAPRPARGGTGLANMLSAVAPRLAVSLLLLLRALPAAAYSMPLRAASLEDAGGSGDAEGSSASSPSPPLPRTPALSPTSLGAQPTPLAGPKPPTNFLDGIVDFFRQYVMLIAVVGSLAFLLMFIVCAALITRQKHKASAYYPSSFPKKKYVDQSDRAGGPRAFSEVPDRAPDGRPEEALDSSQQLQADILAATQNLRSPTRAALGGGDGARLDGKSEGDESGGREVDQEARGRGSPAEKAAAPAEPCPAGVEGALEADPGPGPGEPESAPSPAQEARGPADPPESPCACSVAPKV